jgi:hypothetical protein
MTLRLTMPNLASSATSKDGKLNPAWSQFLRELLIHANTEASPGRVAMFEPAEADVADPEKFVDSGATEGLGVGPYLGWAYCNGNNGTTDRVAEFAAFTTLVPLMRV